MVIVPTRWPPSFAATLKETEPLPVPLSPDLMEIHEALLTAVHEQPAVAVTLMFIPFPPFFPIDWLIGAMEYVHGGGAADCVTVKVCPATVRLPVRCAPVLAAIVKATLPLPLPDAPLVTASHGALLVAAHAHPLAALTAIAVPAPPPAGAVCDVGLMVYAQACDCVTVNVCPAIVSVPIRCAPVFAAALNPTVPPPVLLAPLVIVSHGALLVAVHVHPAAVVTVTGDPAPPDAAIVVLPGAIE